MMQVNIFKYVIFSILYKYCLTVYLMTSCSKGTVHTVRRHRCHFLVPPHRVIHRAHTSTARKSIKLLFCIQVRISIIKHARLDLFCVIKSSHAPSMQWAGSPTTGAPPAWPPPPLIGFRPPSGLGYWRPPLQPYPGQPGGPPPPQMGQGYWPPPL
jgi:hypothetical protein